MSCLESIKNAIEEIIFKQFPDEYSSIGDGNRLDHQLTSMQLALVIAHINSTFQVRFGSSLSDISALTSIHDLSIWVKEKLDDSQ